MFLRVKTNDIWENKVTLETFNPIKRIIEHGDEVIVILRNIETKEEISVRLNDFKDNYKLRKSGALGGTAIFL